MRQCNTSLTQSHLRIDEAAELPLEPSTQTNTSNQEVWPTFDQYVSCVFGFAVTLARPTHRTSLIQWRSDSPLTVSLLARNFDLVILAGQSTENEKAT